MHHLRLYVISLVTLLVAEDMLALALADQARDRYELARDSSNDLDEGSCICGLNKEILNKIETIVKHASNQAQSCFISTSGDESSDFNVTGHSTEGNSQVTTLLADDRDESTAATNVSEKPESVHIESSTGSSSGDSDSSATTQDHDHESLIAKLTEEIKTLEAQLASSLRPHDQHGQPSQSQQSSSSSSSSSSLSSSSLTSSLTSTWRPQQQQPKPVPPTAVVWGLAQPTGSIHTSTTSNSEHEIGTSDANGSQENGTSDQVQIQPIKQPDVQLPSDSERPISSSTTSFLQGIPTSSVSVSSSSNQESNGVPTTSGQSGVRPTIQTVQSTLVTTVPNVVSNIFSNIQDLAIQTEQNPDSSVSGQSQSSNYLTSIDGSSVHISTNETADEITAQGEMLFMQWIEHQIQALHMTASMASYIRRSALSLFRRIVKQYVERISKLGGRVEDNVRKATQIALNNTQNLTSFLLRNYLNVAGGLMQIIGEQVSRVGKQLDSTGETIANINLNPFDIVSNVLASLPNPARYSEYFRAFGKYLMGEQDTGNLQQQQSQYQSDNDRRRGLLSKTMGALGKTLGSWLG